jgi:hypothetical protein
VKYRSFLREKRGQGRPRSRVSVEEAPGPPAESEYLQRKSIVKFNRAKKLTTKAHGFFTGYVLFFLCKR